MTSVKPVTAALGGIGTLLLAGGTGENAPIVRARICAALGLLGIDLEENPVLRTRT